MEIEPELKDFFNRQLSVKDDEDKDTKKQKEKEEAKEKKNKWEEMSTVSKDDNKSTLLKKLLAFKAELCKDERALQEAKLDMKGKAGCKDELKILSPALTEVQACQEKDREGHQQWKQEGRKQEGIVGELGSLGEEKEVQEVGSRTTKEEGKKRRGGRLKQRSHQIEAGQVSPQTEADCSRAWEAGKCQEVEHWWLDSHKNCRFGVWWLASHENLLNLKCDGWIAIKPCFSTCNPFFFQNFWVQGNHSTMAKRRRILYVKGEETADPRYAHWVLDPNEDSQVLIPPSPEVVESEEEEGEEEEGQGEEENPARPATDSAEEGKQEKKDEQPELN